MADPLVYAFRDCLFRVWPETRYCETLFKDGTRAPATRECEVGNLEYAVHLGYLDCWRALVEHEIGHTLIAERMGNPYSPTLWAVAHDYARGTAPYEERLYEEALVLAVQKFTNTRRTSPILNHPKVWPYFAAWGDSIRKIAERFIPDVETRKVSNA